MFQFSLKSLFEFCLAVAVVLAAYTAILPIADVVPPVDGYVAFFPAKLLIAFRLRKHRALAIALYLLSLALMTGFSAYQNGFLFEGPKTLAQVTLAWLLAWFSVPSITFALDLCTAEQARFRFLLWRTTLEIAVLCPITAVAVGTILAMLVLPI